MKSAKRNITMLYLVKIAKWFMLAMPIIVLFYQDNGLGMTDVLTLQAVYSISIVIMEIPSGYMADIWGRRNTIILGAVLGTVGFGVYSFSFGFLGFLCAELILGIGQSLISGADSAMLYDTLFEQNRQDEYLKYEGRVLSLGNFSETFAAIAGGLLAEISLRTPFIAQIFVAFIAIPAAFILYEPIRTKQVGKGSIKRILAIVKYSIFTNINLRRNIFYSSLIGCATLTMAWFLQPYLFDILNFSKSEIGIAWSLLNLVVGLTTLIAYKIEKKVGMLNIVILIAILIPAGYIAMGFISSLWIIPILFVFYFTRGIATPVLKDYINRITESDIRATVLSVRNFVIRILFSIIGPFLGYYSDLYSLQSALLLAGCIFALGSIFTTVLYAKSIMKSTKKNLF
ncbi:MAG TPA: MFS transporter [Bacteroidales bacterium]|nr:MFS transporter [Bacteroidales bacterium]